MANETRNKKTVKASAVKPTEPKRVKPTEPKRVKPTEPKRVKSTEPKRVKSTEPKRVKSTEPKQEFLDDVKEKADDVMDDIKEGASDLWGKIKTGAERVGDFVEDASELGMLKVDILKLEGKLDKVFSATGKKLWKLHEADKLSEVESTLTEDFEQIGDLQKELKLKKKKAGNISLVH